MMENEVTIAQVSIKNSDTDFELITLHEFLKKPAFERSNLIIAKRVEFIDFSGVKIPTLDALKSITSLIKKLREEGKLINSVG